MNKSQSSMNPTEIFPFEITEKIFGNLKGRDLKNCLLVSPKWNNQILTSRICMKKMSLKINDNWKDMTSDERDNMMKNRNYQHVKISEAAEISDSLPRLMGFGHQWKSVCILNTEFSTTLKFIELVANIHGTVENLELYGIIFKKYYKGLVRSIPFSHLTTMTISKCEDGAFNNIFNDCPALNSLMMYQPIEYDETPFIVFEMLQRLKSLKKFHFDRQWLDLIFNGNNNTKTFPFHLEDLSITNLNFYRGLSRANSHFAQFLRSQSSDIKKLHLGDILGRDEEILKISYQMQHLKTFSAFHFPLDNVHDLDIPLNNSIDRLELKHIWFSNQNQLSSLLKASPNIKSLNVRQVDHKSGTVISSHLHKLQYVCVLGNLDKKTIEALPSFKVEKIMNHFQLTRNV